MINDKILAEKRFADIKADEYRRRGYVVSREEPLETVPGFLADLVVRKDGYSKVVEVRTHSSLGLDQRLDEVAKIVNETPDWSFELHLIPDADLRHTPPMAHDFGEAGIVERLHTAEHLINEGFIEPAFLMAWAATEAATRTLITARGITIDSVTSPLYLLNQAAFHDVIHPEEYDHLRRLSTYRNAVVHGLQAVDLDVDMVKDLINVASRFVASARPTSDFTARIDTLRGLHEGWLVGTGLAPSEEGLNWLNARFTQAFQSDAPLPYVEATPSGGVELIWPMGPKGVNLDIDLSSHIGRMSEYDRLSDTWNEIVMNLDDDQNWNWLFTQLRYCAEQQSMENLLIDPQFPTQT